MQLLDKEMLELYPKTKELKKLMTLIGRDELSFEVCYCVHVLEKCKLVRLTVWLRHVCESEFF